MTSVSPVVEPLVPDLAATRLGAASTKVSGAQDQDVSQQFDAIVLRQMLESILPDAKGSTFGGGAAGGVWRSMMADQIAGLLSKSEILGTSSIGKNGNGAQQ